MRAHMPRKGKTLADKMFIDRARSEEQWVMTGANLGIRLVLCELARNHNFGGERLKKLYFGTCDLWMDEIQQDPELGEARMQEMLDKRMGKGWEDAEVRETK